MKLKNRNNSNYLIIGVLILALAFITVGYSYVKTTLSIGGNTKFSEEITYPYILGKKMEAHPDNVKSTYVTSAGGIDFNEAPSNTNGKGLYLFSSTKNDTYPIYYFRGGEDINGDGIEDSLNNNVLFGGFCWKIVRTTEKGGTKLIYNGIPINDQCNNIGEASQLNTISAFNTNQKSLADVGYMYGTRYGYTSWTDTAYVYGSDVTYNTSTKVYTLTSPASSNTLANVKTKHYTCKLTTNGTCGAVYYVYSFYNNNVFAIELTNGKKLENIISESFANENNSVIKSVIDGWFKEKLIGQESKLEDAVWCNDRSFSSGGYIKDADLTTISTINKGSTYLEAYDVRNLNRELTQKPALKDVMACPNKSDRYTKSDTTVGNGALTYPVGLLTADEAAIAGSGAPKYSSESYLNSGQIYWLLTPYTVARNGVDSRLFTINNVGSSYIYYAMSERGVRPSIVLNKDVVATSGDGTITKPYVIE